MYAHRQIQFCFVSTFVYSLDPRNIIDFPVKWIKGLGLDTTGDDSHKAYIAEFCDKVLSTVKDLIMQAMESTTLSLNVMDGLYQEVLWHTHYATSKFKNYFVSFKYHILHKPCNCLYRDRERLFQ